MTERRKTTVFCMSVLQKSESTAGDNMRKAQRDGWLIQNSALLLFRSRAASVYLFAVSCFRFSSLK